MKIRAYADLHLFKVKGEMNRYINEELQILKEGLLNNPPDLLVFSGDLTDRPYPSDDIRFIETMNFISDIVRICESKRIHFRMIGGTASHDGKIVEILKNLYKGYNYVKFFTTVTYETIDGIDFRYIPESYFGTYSEFRKYAFDDKISDITFFHGCVSNIVPFKQEKKDSNITNLPKSITIELSDIINHTRLFSAGGHIHKHINYKDKVFYINSLTTMNYADIDDIKGYMEFEVTKNNYTFKYIPNYNAPKYLERIIDDIHLISNSDMRTKISSILLEIDSRDHIRFTVSGKKDFNGMSNLSLLKTMLKKYKFNIKTVMEDEELKNSLSDTIDFYTDNSIPISEKIQKLLEENHHKDVSIEEIEDIIYNK